MNEKVANLTCPSAQPDMQGATVFGLIQGTPESPQVAYLKKEAVVDLSRLPNLGGLSPGHVFRIAAQCEQSKCVHYSGERCALVKRIVANLPEVVEALPACRIRPTCRWHAEEGRAACLRCPQVMTYADSSMENLTRVAKAPDSALVAQDGPSRESAC
jgi:hypothetical protein